MITIFKPTRQLNFTKKVYGFDIETCNKNKSFLCASVYLNDNKKWIFYNKKDLINFFKTKRFCNSYVVATNLGFDFNGTFFNSEEIKDFFVLYRGSDLIIARTFIKGTKFHKINPNKKANSLTFIDTMNYAKLSVDKLGKILKLPKLKKPSFLGKYPKNKAEWEGC